MPTLRKTPLKKKEKSISWYKSHCDTLMSKLVRELGYCQKCHKTDVYQLQHAHIVSRANLRLRYSMLNSLCLCYSCHIFWAHRNPLDFVEWVKTTFPDRFPFLIENKNIQSFPKLNDYKELYEVLKNKEISKLVVFPIP